MESNQLRIGNLVKFNDKISEVIEVRKNLIRAEYLMDIILSSLTLFTFISFLFLFFFI
jgi:hypothetical protein